MSPRMRGGPRRRGRLVGMATCLAAVAGTLGTARAHVEPGELVRETTALVAGHPDDPRVHLQQARAHRAARQWTAALDALTAAAARGADADEVAAERAVVLLAAGRPALARRELDRLLARRPDAFGARLQRARACLALGRPGHAARDFARAIPGMPQPRPEDVIAWHEALLSVGRGEQALTALDAGMARLGPIVSLQLPAVDIEVALGHTERALARLDALLARTDNPAWIARRGDVLARAGRRDEARTEYVRARSLITSRHRSAHGRGFAELDRRLDAALASLTRMETRP